MTDELRMHAEGLRNALSKAHCFNAALIITAVVSMIADGRGDGALSELAHSARSQAGRNQAEAIQPRRLPE